ncbi:hypothetical protein ACFL57_04670 [Candidatus Margulisiibacteriota bacterium]
MSEISGKIGEVCETAGEYECSVCGAEIFLDKGKPFPECDICHDPDLKWMLR